MQPSEFNGIHVPIPIYSIFLYLSTHPNIYNQGANMEQPSERAQEVVDKNKLYVSNLDSQNSNRKTQSDLREIFSKYGTITSINIKRNEKFKKLYAFVVFQSAEEASEALDNLNGQYFGDAKIKVEYQKSQRRQPRQPRDPQDEREVASSGKYLNTVTCFRCRQVGHFARDCKQKPDNEQRGRNRDRQEGNRHRRRSSSHEKKKKSNSSSSSSSSSSGKKNDRHRRNRSRSSSSSSGSSSA